MNALSATSLKNLERGLVAFAVALILLSGFLLSSHISLRSVLLGWADETGGVTVGEVTVLSGQVRRKAADGSEFVEASAQDTLFNYDTVITGAHAGTTLRMKDGSEITLGPRTMVRIFYEDTLGIGGIHRVSGINLISGEVIPKVTGPGLKIVAGGKVVNLPTDAPIVVAAATLEGVYQRKLPELEVRQRESREAKPESPGKSEKPEKNTPLVRFLSPRENAVFKANARPFTPKQVISFQWTQIPKEVPTTIELFYLGLAKTPGTEPKLLLTKNIESGVESRKFNVTVDRPGLYEWKMTLPDTEISTAKTIVQSFQISRTVEMIELQVPSQETATSAFSGKHLDDLNLAFRWKPLPGIDAYTLKVFADAALQRPLYEKEISGPTGEARNDNLIKGSQYFLVQAKLPGGYIATSRVGKIGFDFVPPVLALPRNAETFQKAKLTKGKNQIVFTWRKTNFTEHYAFQISASPQFEKVMYEVKPKGNFTVVKRDLPKGVYFWRVKSVGKGTASDPSRPNRFEIR